jgi:hypothetical protein
VAWVGTRSGAALGRTGRGEAARGWWRTRGAGLAAESGDAGSGPSCQRRARGWWRRMVVQVRMRSGDVG